MQSITGKKQLVLLCLARTGCDVDIVHFRLSSNSLVGGIESPDLLRNCNFSPVIFLRKWSHAPIGDGQDKHSLAAFFGVCNGGVQQGCELFAVFGDGAAAVLVVDAYEQGDYIVGVCIGIGPNGGHEFVSGPAGGGYYFGSAEVYALAEKDGGGLYGEAAIAGNGFAYGVGIAQTKHGVWCRHKGGVD